MSIIERVLFALKENSKKMSDLAVVLSLNTSTIANWKTRNTDPPARYIAPICEFLNISVEWLLTGKDEMRKSSDVHVIESSTNTNSNDWEDEYESILLSPDANELVECYKRLDTIDQIKILERVKTTLEIKEEQKSTGFAKGKRIKNPSEETATDRINVS